MSVCQEKRGQKMRSACHPCKNVPPHHKSKTGVCLQKREVSFGACSLFWARVAHLFFKVFYFASLTQHFKYLNIFNIPPYCPVPGLGKDCHYHLYINKKSVILKKKKIFNTLWSYSGKMLVFPPTTEVYSDQLKNSNNLPSP